jgi:hypothetical protein
MFALTYFGAEGPRLPTMTGPAAEAVVRGYLAKFEKLRKETSGNHMIYFPEREGPVEEWVDTEAGDSPENYIAWPLSLEQPFASAVDSLILIAKPTTGKGFVTLSQLGSYPQLFSFTSLNDLILQTKRLLDYWQGYREPKRFPWGWVAAAVVLAGAVGGTVWYVRRR